MSVRGIHTDVTDMREKIFTEVARLAYEGGDYSRLEELPYKIVPGELASFRESVFTERAIVGEYARAAYKMNQEGQKGCKTVFDVAPAYLSAESGADLRKKYL